MNRAVGYGLIFATLLLTGCGSAEDDPKQSANDANIVLEDQHNYLSSSVLTIPTVETASGADLDICWSDIEADLQCHDVAAQADVDNVALLRFLHLSQEQVAARLAGGQLAQSEIDGYVEYNTDKQSTCTKLSTMSFFGTPVDINEEYFASDEHTFMLLFAKGTTPGVGARTMTFVEPTTNSMNTTVTAPNGCELLDFDADLSSLSPITVPLAGPWRLDWRNVTRDSQGNAIAFEAIDSALIGFYEGKSVSDLQANILDIELIATSLWEIQLTGGRTANLANAQQRETGELFSGFERDQSGTWLFALMCSTCQNPAPLVLSVLAPE
jgi:hypothetical protein